MKKVHFIGICGKGMSSVAKLLIDSGLEVTGSDEGFYPPVSDYLLKYKIPCATPHKKENIQDDVDTIVIGKHAKLIKETNEEVAEAFRLKDEGKVNIYSFPEILKELTKERENLVVVGSFGKSTCTALLAHILEFSGLNVGYFIGATPITPESNANIGTHKYFVLEGDEYPSANWDNTSKFMYYSPKSILLTAMAHDHTNIFKTHEDFKKPFFELIKTVPHERPVVACLDEETILNDKKKIIEEHKNTVFYSLENPEAKYTASNIIFGEVTKFDVLLDSKVIGSLETGLLGKHNIQNILGVVAFILENNILDIEDIFAPVKSFVAVEGRLNEIKTKSGIKMYEGFGSSVDKAKSAIEAIKLHYPNKDIIIIFEPHTFSWRNKEAIHWYDTVFSGAKKVYVYEPPHHGAATINQLTQQEIVERVKSSGVDADSINNHEEACKNILENRDTKKDVILTLSSGNFDGLIDNLRKEV